MTQKEALKILEGGHNAYLTGAAGSGKTYLLNEYIRLLKKRGVNVGITASTGIAATHIGGLTIHSWAGIGVKDEVSDTELKIIAGKRRIAKRFRLTDVLIIDEISMLDANRLDMLERLSRFARGNFSSFGGMQVVLSGDFFQLPPVAAEGKPLPRFAYQSDAWKTLDLKVCYLHERHRHDDPEFLGILDAIRGSAVTQTTTDRLRTRLHAALPEIKRITKLYAHNLEVDAENARELAKLPGEAMSYFMETRGVPAIAAVLKRGCLAPEELILKKDAVVMFVKNNFEKGYVNGTLGTVLSFDESGHPLVKTSNGRIIAASPATWDIEENGRIVAEIKQIPLRLAWAITIHKSQGITLDAAEIDLSNAFEKGMGYVALSRVRSLRGIRLLGLNNTALEVHPEIIAFDKTLKERSENARQKFSNMPKNVAEYKPPKTYSVEKIREKHPAAYKKWLPREEKQLRVNFSKGEDINTLAQAFGRKSGGIRSRLKKLGLLEKST